MNNKEPLEILSDTLAVMTARAIEAEAEIKEVCANADRWYQNWRRADEQLQKTEEKLKEVRRELHTIRTQQKFRKTLREKLQEAEEGAAHETDN